MKISGGEYRNPNISPKPSYLLPLPEDNDILKTIMNAVLIYTDYVVTFKKNNSSKLGPGPDNTLPLSLIKISPKSMDQALEIL